MVMCRIANCRFILQPILILGLVITNIFFYSHLHSDKLVSSEISETTVHYASPLTNLTGFVFDAGQLNQSVENFTEAHSKNLSSLERVLLYTSPFRFIAEEVLNFSSLHASSVHSKKIFTQYLYKIHCSFKVDCA